MLAWDLEDHDFCPSGHLLECDKHVRSSPRVTLRRSWQPFTPLPQCELHVCRAVMGELIFSLVCGGRACLQHPLIHPRCPSNKSRACSLCVQDQSLMILLPPSPQR